MVKKFLIILPTLNEKKNIIKLNELFKSFKFNVIFHYLYIDDCSTDGTRAYLKCFSKNNNHHYLFRNKRLGIGKAHLDGIFWAYKNKFDYAITMDTDLAHDPKYILSFFKKKYFDVCIGSRYIRKMSTPGWDKLRIFLSYSAHKVSKFIYGIEFDTTNGFRCYNLKKIKITFFRKMSNYHDYDFFQTSAVLMYYNKFIIKQFPMKIYGRVTGNSKMLLKHMFKSIFNMFFLYFNIKK